MENVRLGQIMWVKSGEGRGPLLERPATAAVGAACVRDEKGAVNQTKRKGKT